MGMWKAVFAGFALAVATLGLSGCGSSDDDKNYVEQPVELLYNRALDDLGAQEYKAAAKGFEEVDRPGVDTWGFARWRRLDADLARFAAR